MFPVSVRSVEAGIALIIERNFDVLVVTGVIDMLLDGLDETGELSCKKVSDVGQVSEV